MIRFILLSLILLVNSALSADFNIKLRKTDINDLKQQLLPAFEQNILYLNSLLQCLEQGHSTDACLDKFPPPGRDLNEQQGTHNAFKGSIKKNLDNRDLAEEDIIKGLKDLLLGAQKVKKCLIEAQSANNLKDCFVKYKNKAKSQI